MNGGWKIMDAIEAILDSAHAIRGIRRGRRTSGR
jgi:hypothetical protein